MLVQRLTRLEAQEAFAAATPGGAMPRLPRRFDDTALSANGPAMRALEAFVLASQILCGSELPIAPGMMARTIAGLAAHGFSADEACAIERANALRLFPRRAA